MSVLHNVFTDSADSLDAIGRLEVDREAPAYAAAFGKEGKKTMTQQYVGHRNRGTAK